MAASFFENLVVDLIVAVGYGGSRTDAGESLGKSGDEGIDGRRLTEYMIDTEFHGNSKHVVFKSKKLLQM